MAPRFGTSGLRGLVTELNTDLVTAYANAFLAVCPAGTGLHVGRDLRPSSPRIADDVIAAALDAGLRVHDCGALPTPALALAAMSAGAASVMVTGSHIPADRNGLKFYLPTGEITKLEEAAISAAFEARLRPAASAPGSLVPSPLAASAYVGRYVGAFGPSALSGLRVGIYQHSSVARDAMAEVCGALGATTVALARSDRFIPVDTEAVDRETRAQLAAWCASERLDAILSTDGDADRPMLADASGRVIPGDVLGVLTARTLGATVVCTPVSSNSMVSVIPEFSSVRLTRIGSPFVIAAMEAARAADPAARVAGFEANGGFLLGFRAAAPAGDLAPLMTRDAFLPMLAPLAAARAAGRSLAELVEALPPRFTAADRLAGIDPAAALALLDRLADDQARAAFLSPAGREVALDRTDGLRATLSNGDVVHLRPSGNAPEFRIYTESDEPQAAADLLAVFLDRVRGALDGRSSIIAGNA
ncbi:phosphomannomutase [Aquibium microcysteis]|uniref:phosphomannomutase n=1 Tax=Aquibium microcysteis TaxID=675281 RepID=UPI00165D2908|nr:phosphomannomutase [Aquibium microcysteis]